MPQQTSSLKTYFDELEETNGDDECKAWLSKALDSKAELAVFVAARREGGGTARYVGFLKGSFNMSFQFSFGDGRPDVVIRVPKPGHTAAAYRDEKVENEVQIMEYLQQNTDIPIPRVHSWGLMSESPEQLGPFIIVDFVNGALVSTILKQPDQEGMVLNPWWLLLSGPELWLERGAMDEFLTLYEPRMEQFLRALERVEIEMASKAKQTGGPSLSTRMRDAWRTG